jgi:hypothetical protein
MRRDKQVVGQHSPNKLNLVGAVKMRIEKTGLVMIDSHERMIRVCDPP